MKKYMKYSIGAILLLAFIALIWYHIPVKTQKTVMACTVDGETAEVTFDLSYERHLLGENRCKGTITVNGITYEDMGGATAFAKEGSTLDTMHDNLLVVTSSDNRYRMFYLYVKTEETARIYYGEAQNAEEAGKVMNKFLVE